MEISPIRRIKILCNKYKIIIK